ncbi:MAG: hypothetical protein C0410_16010, partial [Anaerolinea sp.]|nr:hypothetical protein [Anaerolinea sp.]
GEISISCYYLTPDKNSYSIMTVDDDGSTISTAVTKTKTFPVVKSDGKAASGVYTAICEDEYGVSKQTTQFTVEDDPYAEVSILEVNVMEGEQYHYALSFKYVIRIPDSVSFTCNYVAPGGGTYFMIITRILITLTNHYSRRCIFPSFRETAK